MNYIIQTTDTFDNWLNSLKDLRAKAKVITRLERAAEGNLGDHKSVGGGVGEMRITESKSYRLYYTIRGNTIIFMLNGATKAASKPTSPKPLS